MAFILDFTITTSQSYIKNIIIATAKKNGVFVEVTQNEDHLLCAFDEENEALKVVLEELEKLLPASIFLKSSTFVQTDQKINSFAPFEHNYPLNLGLCPSCQKEMFDVSSRRYYYPFTSCSCCGGGYSFFQKYPYKRENTTIRYIQPCLECQEEIEQAGQREKHHINSCHKCGIPVRLQSKNNQRYANDAGSFRTMFEVAAKAINDNKTLLIKTTLGYRLFYKLQNVTPKTNILFVEADKITDHCSLISEEFHALLSIERPVLHVALKNEKLKEIMGYNTAFVKYPDDGFTILLAVEIKKLGLEYIGYEEADEDTVADFVMDYDIEINPQEEIRYFINKDVGFIASGERVAFPYTNKTPSDVLSIAHSLAGVKKQDMMIFDRLSHFESVDAMRLNHIGALPQKHPKQFEIAQDEASFMSVIVEHNLFGQKCVGAYFGDETSFLYYNGKNVVRAVPPNSFHTKTLIEDIKQLREGSNRLIENLKNQLPEVYERLEKLQEKENANLFEAVAIILDIEDKTFRGLSKEAMRFTGKGGIQIDTHVIENKFNYTAMVASIISYKLAGVSNTILSYSFFESFGDYFNDILHQIKAKTQAQHFIICGESFGNQSLFSRIYKNLKLTPPYINKSLPIGKYNGVVGAAYI